MNPQLGFGQLPGAAPRYGNPNKKKMLILFSLVVIIVLGIAGFLLFGNKSDPTRDRMVEVAIAEGETLRVSSAFSNKINDTTLQHHNAELEVILPSSQRKIVAELTRSYDISGISPDAQKLAISKKSDDRLNSATKINRFDEEYATLMVELLTNQIKLLQEAQSSTDDKQTRSVLAAITTDTSALRDRFSAVTSNPSD